MGNELVSKCFLGQGFTCDIKLEDLPGLIYWKDANGQYQGGTREFLNLLVNLGINDGVVGKTDFDFLNEQEAESNRFHDHEVLQNATPQAFLEQYTIGDKTHLFHVNKSPLTNAQGTILGVIAVASDITAYSRSDMFMHIGKTFKSKLKFLDDIVSGMPGNLYWKNKEGVYIGSNNFQVNPDLQSSDVIGKTDYELWPMYAEEIRKHDHYVMETGKQLTIEEVVTDNNGFPRYFMADKMPLRDDNGDIIGVIGNSSDITELKNTQTQLEIARKRSELADQAKMQFLATVSHELRTPLNCILGMSEILKIKLTDLKYHELASDIHASGQHLLSLVDDILDFSKLSSDTLVLHNEIFELSKFIDEIVNNLRFQVVRKPIEIKVQFDKKIDQYICADRRRLKQIILNLGSNAIKFTPAGEITIAVELNRSTPKPTFTFSINDTGIGIPEDKQTIIFERFAQINTGYTRNYEGIGLGLAICKQLITQMGGEIFVSSAPGKGSRFWFELALDLIDIHDIHSDTRQNDTQQVTVQRHILLVEDNKLNQKVAIMLLEQENCTVDLAENGKQALAKILENSYDCVLMDLSLPDIDGIEITKQIRAHSIDEFELPIIAVTAHAYEETRLDCIKAGMNDVLNKPISIEKLRELFKHIPLRVKTIQR